MPTAALIDLNHIALKHLDKAFWYLEKQEYDQCTASLHAVNAALPPEYHITFDTSKYYEMIKHPIEVFCKSCGDAQMRDELKTWDMVLTIEQQLLSGKKTIKAWTCSGCEFVNILEDSKMVEKVREEPFFTKVVPEPPTKKQELGDRTAYHIKYKAWFGMVVAELTRQISKLRWDHWKQGEGDFDSEALESTLAENLEDKF